MILYYLKSAFRNLKSNKKFTIINITGFAFGISICLAIVLFLMKEYSYDRCYNDAERIFRLYDAKQNNSSIDYRVREVLTDNFPEIENACIVQLENFSSDVQIDSTGYLVDNMLSVDNNFFRVFNIPFIYGNPNKAFNNPNSVILTESLALKLFGNVHVVGYDMKIWNEVPVTVSGVIKDFPDNSSISSGLLVNSELDDFKFSFSCGDYKDKSTHRYPFRIYIKKNKNADTNELLTKLNNNIELFKPYIDEAGLLPLTDMYLKDTTSGSDSKQGNLALMKLLASIAAIILILAIINYINLTVAQQNKRNKDTGIRKTVGAYRNSLLYYFLSESVLVTFFAMLLAVALLWMLLPVYALIFGTSINFNSLFVFPDYLYLIASILIIGVISGIGPAIVLSRVSPVKVLSGTVVTRNKYHLRNSLTIFQFAISIVLIFCVTVIHRQISYVKHSNPGFKEEQLVYFDVPWTAEESRVESFVNELREFPDIQTITGSNGVPGRIRLTMGTNIEGSDKNIGVPSMIVDENFLETFQMKVIKGRTLQPATWGMCAWLMKRSTNISSLKTLLINVSIITVRTGLI